MTDSVSHTEAVLAFVYDVMTWREMESDERLEWCRRVALVLDDSTNDKFGAWTQTALAPVLGISRETLSKRISWSERRSKGDHSQAVDPGGRKVYQRASDARRFLADPAIPGERKAEILAEALSDEYVAERLADAIGSDPSLIARYEKAKTKVQPSSGRTHGEPLNPDDWQTWTAAQQEEFDSKTIKAARHLLIANFLRSQGYVATGEAEMLLNIVRPPSDMDSELQELIAKDGRL